MQICHIPADAWLFIHNLIWWLIMNHPSTSGMISCFHMKFQSSLKWFWSLSSWGKEEPFFPAWLDSSMSNDCVRFFGHLRSCFYNNASLLHHATHSFTGEIWCCWRIKMPSTKVEKEAKVFFYQELCILFLKESCFVEFTVPKLELLLCFPFHVLSYVEYIIDLPPSFCFHAMLLCLPMIWDGSLKNEAWGLSKKALRWYHHHHQKFQLEYAVYSLEVDQAFWVNSVKCMILTKEQYLHCSEFWLNTVDVEFISFHCRLPHHPSNLSERGRMDSLNECTK